MSSINIIRESNIVRTPRVLQLEGIFDVPPSKKSRQEWSVNLNIPDVWNIGLIVGSSGSGKTTVANELFGDYIVDNFDWSYDKSILDDFPQSMGIKEISDVLSSVGFSSPPSWLRPYRVLSNGEKFRVNMARALSEKSEMIVVDEFTSVVDRTVAKVGSFAIQKAIRRTEKKFIAVSCHYDILDWLEPDWVYQPETNEFYNGRYLHQRPKIELKIKRVDYSAWKIFRKHHYMTADINTNTNCFVAFWNDIPVAFQAWCHFPHATRIPTKRISRTVVLPDYQGVGIGQRMTDYLASIVSSIGYSAITTTSHPARTQGLLRSKNWRMTKKTSMNGKGSKHSVGVKKIVTSFGRFTTAFEYIGDKIDKNEAINVWNG